MNRLTVRVLLALALAMTLAGSTAQAGAMAQEPRESLAAGVSWLAELRDLVADLFDPLSAAASPPAPSAVGGPPAGGDGSNQADPNGYEELPSETPLN